MVWFLGVTEQDVLFYGNSLFSSDITRAMGIENTIKGKAIQVRTPFTSLV
jgi:hypothetical protein